MRHPEWDLLRGTSRTFYISIRQLPGRLGEAFCLAYLLLRISDYLEDNTLMTPEQKNAELLRWHQVLLGRLPAAPWVHQMAAQNFLDGSPDSQALEQAEAILALAHRLPEGMQAAIFHHVPDSTLGMARWVLRGPDILTEEDLDDYMHEVAGRVGYLSTELFACHVPVLKRHLDRLMPLARETGLALQTVNIIRGLRKDLERGWVYVPESFCKSYGIRRADLFEPTHRDQAVQVVGLMAQKAERHLKFALSYIVAIPQYFHSVRLACIWPLAFAIRTLALSRGNLHQVLSSEVKISREEVKRIVRDSSLFGWSNRWLSWYCQRLSQTTLQSPTAGQ